MSCNIIYIGNKLSDFGYTPTGVDMLGRLLEKEGHVLIYGGAKQNKMMRLLNMLTTIYKNRKKANVVLIDTYSTTAFYYAWLCAWLCKLLGLKYIPILRGGNLPARLKQSNSKCQTLFDGSFTNIALSSYLQSVFTKAGYWCELIPNNIELRQYPFKHRQAVKPKLLWVRSFDEIYNPLMALGVLKGLADKYADASLIMVGPDKDGSLAKCKAYAQEQNLHAEFTGKLSKQEWTSLSKQTDIFINTTNIDNTPISVLEAMALGMPIVSTNVGGMRYIIEDGKNGLLVEKGNTDEMLCAIISMIEDDGEACALSKNARLYAEQFDWEIVKHKWNELLGRVND